MIDFNTDIFGTAPVSPEIMMSTTTETVEPMKLDCPEPGVYYDVPAHVYHSWAAVSSTLLKAYAKLPSTARTPYVPGDDANVGSGIHAYSLQGEKGLREECLFLPATCEGKSAKAIAEREMIQMSNPGKALLPPVYGPQKVATMEVLKGVDASLQSHPKIGPVLETSRKEVSVVWIDEETGCICKARFDIWDGSILWDLKKCRSIDGFQWQIKDLGYMIQAGFYYDGALSNNLPAVGFGFIPMEAFPPYQVACGYVEPEKLEAARMDARRLLGLVKESQMNDYWPNFPPPSHIFSWEDLTPDDLVNVY